MQRLRNVLLATDFSPNASRAADRVGRLPLEGLAQVRVLHVMPPATGAAKRVAQVEARAAAKELQVTLAEKTGAKVTTELVQGDAFVEIVRAARRHRAELVVLGRHSKKGRDWGLGTTTERVVRKGSSPVLVVGPGSVRAYARPVVAVDGSDVSRTVLLLAQRVLGHDLPLRLVHAYHVPFTSFMATSMSEPDMRWFRADCRDKARRQIAELIEDLGGKESGWAVTVREGDARAVVLHEIGERDADVVVLGTHGRTGISHFLLGSVAEWVLQNAPCDVLIGRPERFTFELP